MTPAPPEAARRPSPTQRTTRAALLNAGLEFATVAALPRSARWLRWQARLRPRGLAAAVMARTALLFGIHHWALPWSRRIAAERDELTSRLGREPTREELAEHFGWTLPEGSSREGTADQEAP